MTFPPPSCPGSQRTGISALWLSRGVPREEGSITFEGQEIHSQDHRIYLPFVGREVAWISQHASLSFNNRRKIKKHYQDLVKNQGQQAANLRPLEECLEMVGLLPEKIVDKYPFELSGGGEETGCRSSCPFHCRLLIVPNASGC